MGFELEKVGKIKLTLKMEYFLLNTSSLKINIFGAGELGSAGESAVASLMCPPGRRDNQLLQVVLVHRLLRENLTLRNMASP